MLELVKHMFNHAADCLTIAEQAFPLVENSVYARKTKEDIKVHLSQDIIRMLTLMNPAFELMKQEYPDKVEIIQRWERMWSEITKAKDAQA